MSLYNNKPTNPTHKNVGFFLHKWLFITTSHRLNSCSDRVINYSDYDARGTEILQIGCENNRMNGLIETKMLKIGCGKYNYIGLIETITYPTPNDNQQQSTKRTNAKENRAHADNMKNSTRTQRKNKRGNTTQPRIDSTRINSD